MKPKAKVFPLQMQHKYEEKYVTKYLVEIFYSSKTLFR